MKKVLILGSGGREHAIAAKFKQSKHVDQVYVAPGNPGMGDVATVIELDVFDFKACIQFVKQHKIDLTFVGPETLLCDGIVDAFQKEGLCIFGPTAKAAKLEGSKVYSKAMMKKYQIPTARYESFDDVELAKAYLQFQPMPIVLKADGLASGKGVIIAQTIEEAILAVDEMMCNHLFQGAGKEVVIEEYLEGEEFSLLAFVNGDVVIPMQLAQDHKRAFDNDEGLNTGGMGAYTPVQHISNTAYQEAVDTIAKAMAQAMVKEGNPFVGILYSGCMVTKSGVKTIEFNVRFGDPEAEVLLPALESDLYEVVLGVLKGEMISLEWSKDTYCGVVLANVGYPGPIQPGAIIHGIDQCDGLVYHMGTSKDQDGNTTATGGRVLFIGSSGTTLQEAQHHAYQQVEKIKCDQLFYRTDIGSKGIL